MQWGGSCPGCGGCLEACRHLHGGYMSLVRRGLQCGQWQVGTSWNEVWKWCWPGWWSFRVRHLSQRKGKDTPKRSWGHAAPGKRQYEYCHAEVIHNQGVVNTGSHSPGPETLVKASAGGKGKGAVRVSDQQFLKPVHPYQGDNSEEVGVHGDCVCGHGFVI